MGQRYSQRPSDVMEMRQAGISGPTRYDFDRAVMTLARVIDARSQETAEVLEPLPKSAPKGQHYARKPKYTMAELLFPDPAETPDDATPDTDPIFAHLPASMI